MRLKPIFTTILPSFDEIKEGELWISHTHRTINLRCPCGCDELTILSIHPDKWHVHFDGKSVTLKGKGSDSILLSSGCESHYFIRDNSVYWA